MDNHGGDRGANNGGDTAGGTGLNVVFGQEVDSARYLASLNECFGGWGGEKEEELIFHRPFDGHLPDRFALAQGDKWIAGSAVSWRAVASPGGKPALIGIMTGSWTLPAARGRGCFARIINLSREACADQEARWLLAFVTETNASRRQLERAGSAMIPSRYMWSPEDASAVPEPDAEQAAGLQSVEATAERTAECCGRQALQRRNWTHFHYPSPEMWRLQFIDRTLPTEMLIHPSLGTAIVEKHSEFDRLLTAIPHDPDQWLDLAAAVWARALGRGQRFFAYSTRPTRHEALTARCGLGGINGFLTILPPAGTDPAAGHPENWDVESGDRL